jgi:hypothetical protein
MKRRSELLRLPDPVTFEKLCSLVKQIVSDSDLAAEYVPLQPATEYHLKSTSLRHGEIQMDFTLPQSAV